MLKFCFFFSTIFQSKNITCMLPFLYHLVKSLMLTGTVLSVLLILWMEIMNRVSHDVFWIHCFLKKKLFVTIAFQGDFCTNKKYL